MQKHEYLIGSKYGRWNILALDHLDHAGQAYYLCVCDCGTIRAINISSLLKGRSKSCGCLRKEVSSSKGDHRTGTRLYRIWNHIKYRCLCPTCDAYKNYGGRGIDICQDWRDFCCFRNWALQNGYQDNLTIDRINVNDNYCPQNCRWVDRKTQNRNTRQNVYITFGGKTQCAADWADELNISPDRIRERLKRGWSIEKALLTPVKTNKTKGENDG